MRAFIFAYGTRGDVQPCIVLAEAMKKAGHDVVVAGPASSAPLAAGSGTSYTPLDNGLTRLWDNPTTQRTETTNGVRGLPAVRAIVASARRPRIPELRTILADVWAAAQGADLVVHNGPLLAAASYSIAEKLGVPLILSQMYPVFAPTKAFPTALYHFPGGERLPGIFNRASYQAMLFMLRGLTSRAVDTWRERCLGLPRTRARHNLLRGPDGSPVAVLNAVSPHILAPPPDWPEWVHTTGYWFAPAAPGWTPPRELSAFLAAGDPCVYVGFGSMAGFDPGRIEHLAVETARRAGVRMVLANAASADAPSTLSPAVFRITQAPHDWLFRQVSAVVHHGGPGTAAAAIAAGRPQVVCPFMADQPFWGERLHRLGLAPAPIPQAALTAGGLARAIGSVLADPLMTKRSQTLGRLIRAEDGAAAAVAVAEKLCA